MLVPHPLHSLRHFFLFALLFLLLGAFALPQADTAPEIPLGGPTPIRPLEYSVTITGTHTIGDVVEFTHNLGPDPATLHPVWVYSEDGNTLWGVGRYASAFSSLALPSPILFGTGADGDRTVVNETLYVDATRTNTTNTTPAGQNTINIASTSGFTIGDEILIIQMQGNSAGTYEFKRIASVGTNSLVVQSDLVNSYPVDSLARAQVIRVPNYNNLTVNGDGVVTAGAWDGNTGGILVFKVRGNAVINGQIRATGLGYNGGIGGQLNNSPRCAGYQGSSYTGIGGGSINPNAGGGGGGQGDMNRVVDLPGFDVGAGGAGGGYGTNGTNGQTVTAEQGGIGGLPYGSTVMSTVPLGSGGGGGGGDEGGCCPGGAGGRGAGVILLNGFQITLNGAIISTGSDGLRGNTGCRTGGGGGGSGGSIKLQIGTGTIGTNLVLSQGGAGALGSMQGGNGGAGAIGRIRIESCGQVIGTTIPSPSTQSILCHLIEQVESSPFTSTRLTLPETVNSERTYNIYYGRRYLFGTGGEQLKTIRVPVGAWTNVTLDAMLSDFTGGSTTFRLDIGNDGSWDWEPGAVNDATILTSIDLATAFTAYWQSQGSPPSGTLDVPVRVGFSIGGQVILTNLEMVPINPTPTPTPTFTLTPTSVPATSTPTSTETTPTLTSTSTSIPTTPTPTPTGTIPTSTPSSTSMPTTATPTLTVAVPTLTSTTTFVPMTSTPTSTTIVPTLTPTRTPTLPVSDGEVYIPLVLRQYAFATPAPTPTPIPCLTSEIEPNDSFGAVAQHPLLCRNQAINGTFVETTPPQGPEDFYRLEVTTPGVINVHLSSIVAGCDFDLELYDSARNRVGSSYSSGNANESIPYTAQPGTYYVRVYRRTGFSTQPYIVGWQ